MKRDDVTAEPYGGNKVRKLERFFEDAEAQGKRRILTLGAAGSHQVLATAIYGRARGFDVEAVLVPQPSTKHARENLAIALGHGLVAHAAPAWALAPPVVAAHLRGDVYFVPLGGSNVIGSLGYVEAARELAVQIREGVLPEPDVVTVALGSGGTAAGLAAGFEEAKLRTRVVGVAISHPARVLAVMAHRLTREIAKAIGVPPARAAARLEVDRAWVGRGYGYATPEVDSAIAEGTKLGVVLDPTYTAKAFACALSKANDERVLFWHTLSTHPLEGLPRAELPPKLARLLRR
jgi:1-aminocyclopropane-1-carboxylate deaminase/D-cysteine desulfhydrase-like pyridoxal-dependent ACC family enzyme